MTDLARLQFSAEKNAHPVTFPGATQVERMVVGYQSAKASILNHLPPGFELAYDQAMLASEIIGESINRNGDAIQAQLDKGADLYEAIAITMNSGQSRQYILAQYTLACEGLGAFTSGYADLSVQSGDLSKADYDMICEKKLDIFGHIVSLEQKGALGHLLLAEYEADRVAAANAAQGAVRITPTKLYLRTGQNGVEGSVSGLGIDPATVATIIAAAKFVAVVIVAAALVAVCVKLYLDYRTTLTQAQLAHDQCEKAQKYGYNTVIDECKKNLTNLETKGLSEQLFGKAGTAEITKYVAIGVGLFLLISFGPQIVDMVFKTTERVQERRRLTA